MTKFSVTTLKDLFLTCSFFKRLLFRTKRSQRLKMFCILLSWWQIYCYKSLSHNVLGPAGVDFFTSCSLLSINVFLWTWIVHHGEVLIKVIVCHFGLFWSENQEDERKDSTEMNICCSSALRKHYEIFFFLKHS